MSDDLPRPELVIAIDFGMTCTIVYPVSWRHFLITFHTGTGVAFCNVATGEENPRCINKWPGRGGAVVEKVSYCAQLQSAKCTFILICYAGPNNPRLSQKFHYPFVMGFPCGAPYRADE
jgi:hypothetical protein